MDRPVFRKHAKYNSIYHKTFLKQLGLLTRRVEKKISQSLPNLFCSVFVGRSEGDTNYVSIHTSYYASCNICYQTNLLDFPTLEEEISEDAKH